jgi:histidinol-phosphatase (PHP family)
LAVQIPFDYHMHSDHSCDCRIPMSDMCRSAISKGILEIAFTEHFDPKPEDICSGKYYPAQFFASIEECRAEFGPQGLIIKAGVEVGEMHLYREEVNAVLNVYPYDLVLGSLHWCRGESVFRPEYFSKRDAQTAACDYFAELLELAEGGGFNILSHLDVVKRLGFTVYNQFDINEFENEVRPILAACIRNGIAPEINTSALRMVVNQTHPTLEVIRWYREMGGELLSIGSDSHRPDHLGLNLDKAIEIAKEAGFTRLTHFAQRQVESFANI